MAFKQGYYKVKHPEKYIGDSTRVRYLSSWELEFDKFLDSNPNVIRWASEAFYIPYRHPVDKQTHRYFPDYYVEYKNNNGQIIREIIEIKPQRHTELGKRPTTYEQLSHAINISKWQSAQVFCKKQGIQFRVLTENELFHQGKAPNAKKNSNRRTSRTPSRTSARYTNKNNRRGTRRVSK